MKKIIIITFLLLALGSCGTRLAYSPKDLNKDLVIDTKIKTGVLKNGLRYVIRENKTPEKKAEFRLGISGGSLLEKEDEKGLAHFIEHMAFNGTRNFSRNQLLDFLRENGMSLGKDINAYTTHTETVYRFSLPTAQKGTIDKGFLVLKDWAHDIRFDSDEMNKERGVILEESRAGKSLSKRVKDKVMPLVYGSYYTDYLPIGQENIIETVSHHKLKECYKKWYQPGRMAVVVVGDIDADEIEAKIKSAFSGLKNDRELPALKDFDVPEYNEFQYLSVSDPELTESAIGIYQHIKTRKLLTQRDLRQYLIEQMYLSIIKDRLKKKSLSKASYDQVNCFQDWLTASDGVFYLETRVKKNQFQQSFEEIFIEYERLKRYGVLESEIKEARKALLDESGTALIEQVTKTSRSFADSYIHKSLYKSNIFSLKEYNRLCKKYLPSITDDDINQFLNRIDSNDRVMVSLGNSGSLDAFPNRNKVETVMAKTKSMEIGLYSHKTEKNLSVDTLSKGSIVKTIYHKKANVTVLELFNGARVVLKPTLFKLDDIVFSAYSPGGLSLLAPEFIPLMELADPIFKQSGLGPLTKLELWTKLKSKKINASIYIEPHEEGINGYFSPKNMELFFKLIGLGLSKPRIKQDAFEEQKLTYVRKKREMQNTAFWKLQEKILQTAWAPSEFNEMITADSIQRLEFFSSKEALQSRFQNAGDFTFQFVGNFKMHEILPLIEKYIAGLPASKIKEKPKNVNCKPLPGKFFVSVNENLENQSHVFIQLNHDYIFSEKRLFEFSALETILNIKINEVLREEKSLIYLGHA